MHACALAFLEHGTMGVSSNQRPIRVVHASHGLPNAVFNRNYDTLYARTSSCPLAEAAKRMSEELVTRFACPVLDPELSSCPALNKRDSNSRVKAEKFT